MKQLERDPNFQRFCEELEGLKKSCVPYSPSDELARKIIDRLRSSPS